MYDCEHKLHICFHPGLDLRDDFFDYFQETYLDDYGQRVTWVLMMLLGAFPHQLMVGENDLCRVPELLPGLELDSDEYDLAGLEPAEKAKLIYASATSVFHLSLIFPKDECMIYHNFEYSNEVLNPSKRIEEALGKLVPARGLYIRPSK